MTDYRTHQRVIEIHRAWNAYSIYHNMMRLEGKPKQWVELSERERKVWDAVCNSIIRDIGKEIQAMAILSNEPLKAEDIRHAEELIKKYGLEFTEEQIDELAVKDHIKYLKLKGAIREDGTIDDSKLGFLRAQTFEELEALLKTNEQSNAK